MQMGREPVIDDLLDHRLRRIEFPLAVARPVICRRDLVGIATGRCRCQLVHKSPTRRISLEATSSGRLPLRYEKPSAPRQERGYAVLADTCSDRRCWLSEPLWLSSVVMPP